MRIAFVQSVCGFGGMEKHSLVLARALQEHGHEVRFIGLTEGPDFALLRQWADPQARVPVAFAGPAPQGYGPAREWLQDWKPDVVNAQLPLAPAITAALGIPVIGTVHGIFSMQGRLPDCTLVCLDQRVFDRVRNHNQLVGGRAYRLYNGIELSQLPFRDDAAQRKGACYFGRYFWPKTLALRGWVGVGDMDVYADADSLNEMRTVFQSRQCFRYQRPAPPEEVLYDYRIACAVGTCAIEAMACGALVLAGPLSRENLPAFRDAAYSATVFYEQSQTQVPQDVARLRDDVVATETARLCRAWVEEQHDSLKVAERFLDVYREAGA